MAQLRQDYAEFTSRGAEVLIIGPDGPRAFKRWWQEESMPMPGLADVGSRVASNFGQQVKWLKWGRMPAMFIVDREGRIRWQHFGEEMSDIPTNETVLGLLDRL